MTEIEIEINEGDILRLSKELEELQKRNDYLRSKKKENSEIKNEFSKEINHEDELKIKSKFGIDNLKEFQKQCINVSKDGKDLLLISPTGSGKSICFQGPAILTKGLTVVICPLLSLIRDQIEKLRKSGINVQELSSKILQSEKKTYLEKEFEGKEAEFIYTTPEFFSCPRFLNFLNDSYKKNKLSRFVVDEAHCCSEWGYSFRPTFLRLSSIRKLYPKTPITALTATASQSVEQDIKTILDLQNTVTIRNGVDRENLKIFVTPKEETKGLHLSKLRDFIFERKKSSGIIYCLTHSECETVSSYLNENGFESALYHSGISEELKDKNYKNWKSNKIKIMVATVAFGLGIDKPDVNYVVHNSLPKSLDGYFQECGRAGRNGSPSDCLLFYKPDDVFKIIAMVDGNRKEKIKAMKMAQYCQSISCRREMISSYFGQMIEKCSGCDNCFTKKCYFELEEIPKFIIKIILDSEKNREKLTPKMIKEKCSENIAKETGNYLVKSLLIEMFFNGIINFTVERGSKKNAVYVELGHKYFEDKE